MPLLWTGACGERMLLACMAQRRTVWPSPRSTRASSVAAPAIGVKGRARGDRRLRQDAVEGGHLRAGRATVSVPRPWPGLLEDAHPPGHHAVGAGRPAHRHQLRWLARYRRSSRRPRLWPNSPALGFACPRRVHRRHRSRSTASKAVCGSGQGQAAASRAVPIDGDVAHDLADLQGDRMAIQPSHALPTSFSNACLAVCLIQ